MNRKRILKADPFWQENAKLSSEEIEERFACNTAESLKLVKKCNTLAVK